MIWFFKKKDQRQVGNLSLALEHQEEIETRKEIKEIKYIEQRVTCTSLIDPVGSHKTHFRNVETLLQDMKIHNSKLNKLAIKLEKTLLDARNSDESKREEYLSEDERKVLDFAKNINIHLNQAILSIRELIKLDSNKELIAKITFTVPLSWLNENQFSEKTVRLNTYKEGEWHELPTKFVSKNDVLTYEADAEHFSLFAITANVKEEKFYHVLWDMILHYKKIIILLGLLGMMVFLFIFYCKIKVKKK